MEMEERERRARWPSDGRWSRRGTTFGQLLCSKAGTESEIGSELAAFPQKNAGASGQRGKDDRCGAYPAETPPFQQSGRDATFFERPTILQSQPTQSGRGRILVERPAIPLQYRQRANGG